MDQNKKEHNMTQPTKKTDVGSKAPSTNRPEIDLPLKGGSSDASLANKPQPKKDDKSSERSDSDKKSVR